MYENTPPGDLQKAWHRFVVVHYLDKDIGSIIDIGAGRGKSKERLQEITENVVTQDINNALMDYVDIIEPTSNIIGGYDLVTAFDVFEHIPPSTRELWLKDLYYLSNKYLFVTTPNGAHYDMKLWCFNPCIFLGIIKDCFRNFKATFNYFIYKKDSEKEDIIQVSENEFLSNTDQGLGIEITKESL
jgi:2-polyprenyl-3-methyl-5-hydroxy-6-metoxy-1,4-benzoquinol methylase